MRPTLPFRWFRPGWEPGLSLAEDAARRALADGTWPPHAVVVKDRPMRVTVAATLPGPRGPASLYLKVRRLRTALERRRAARRPRSRAEAQVLEGLRAAGVATPLPLAYASHPDAGFDLLLLEAVRDAVPLAVAWPSLADRTSRRRLAADVGRLLRTAHDAGWCDPDVHRENLLVTPTGPVLIDPGTRALRPPLSPRRRLAALAAATHGLAPDVRSAWAALEAYAGGDGGSARRWFPLVARSARRVTRAYRRGRARRATRSGRHFEVFEPVPGGHGVRTTARTDASWETLAARWLVASPHGAASLKDDGRVVAFPRPDDRGDAVLKRYAPTWRDRFRAPRAIRAFRRAYALRIRGVACPEPLLAATDPSGRGVYVAARAGLDAPAIDLHAAVTRPEAAPGLASLPPRARREALARLGRFLRRMHDAEVSHRDLKAENLVAWPGPKGMAFAVVDLEGARARLRPVPWARRARDLSRLDASVGPLVSRADRLRVLAAYAASLPRHGPNLHALARRVARASAKKRGPSGAPR